jgi:hypothetical protein
MHRCVNVRLSGTFASNSNSVTLSIQNNQGETEITLYDLPYEVTEKFAAFRDVYTIDYDRVAA